MKQEDIIRMARIAGVRDDGQRFEFSEYKYLERFAALVASAEREASAKHAEDFLTKGRSPLGRAVGEAIRTRGQA